MAFDRKNTENGTEALRELPEILRKASVTVTGRTYRGLDRVEFGENDLILGCIFEDCGCVIFDGSRVDGCTFRRVETVFAVGAVVSDSVFCDLSCDRDAVLSLEDSELRGCTFERAELRQEACLCRGTGDCWIEDCRFDRISTERADGEIIVGEDTVGRLFRRRKEFCIVDEDSCTGLDGICVKLPAGTDILC